MFWLFWLTGTLNVYIWCMLSLGTSIFGNSSSAARNIQTTFNPDYLPDYLSVFYDYDITDIFYICLTELAWTFFREPFSNLNFGNGERRTIFISPGNRFQIFATQFEILSILYCVFFMFFCAKRWSLLRL